MNGVMYVYSIIYTASFSVFKSPRNMLRLKELRIVLHTRSYNRGKLPVAPSGTLYDPSEEQVEIPVFYS